MTFDVDQIDRLLTTTRAVRKRLDFDRELPNDLLLQLIDVAEQAPSGSNQASRRRPAIRPRRCSARRPIWPKIWNRHRRWWC